MICTKCREEDEKCNCLKRINSEFAKLSQKEQDEKVLKIIKSLGYREIRVLNAIKYMTNSLEG